jgi:hypothetical protein
MDLELIDLSQSRSADFIRNYRQQRFVPSNEGTKPIKRKKSTAPAAKAHNLESETQRILLATAQVVIGRYPKMKLNAHPILPARVSKDVIENTLAALPAELPANSLISLTLSRAVYSQLGLPYICLAHQQGRITCSQFVFLSRSFLNPVRTSTH